MEIGKIDGLLIVLFPPFYQSPNTAHFVSTHQTPRDDERLAVLIKHVFLSLPKY